jgi:hypothetical protein
MLHCLSEGGKGHKPWNARKAVLEAGKRRK